MRLCLVSAYPQEACTDESVQQEATWLQQSAVALAHQGHAVTWISSLPHGAVAAEPEILPPTCRYVLPCQSVRLGQVPLLVVEDNVWRQPDLHTRLFTFFCLLHRALHWEVVHVWGLWSVIYLGAYTARFLQQPLVVSYGPLAFQEGLQQPFAWEWMAQQPLQAVVRRGDEQTTLAAHMPAHRIQLLDSSLPDPAAAWLDVYRRAMEHH